MIWLLINLDDTKLWCITLLFMIVGHTHNKLDRFFSTHLADVAHCISTATRLGIRHSTRSHLSFLFRWVHGRHACRRTTLLSFDAYEVHN